MPKTKTLDQRATERVEIRLTLTQKQKIEQQARAHGLKVSEYILMVLERSDPYPESTKITTEQLCDRVGHRPGSMRDLLKDINLSVTLHNPDPVRGDLARIGYYKKLAGYLADFDPDGIHWYPDPSTDTWSTTEPVQSVYPQYNRQQYAKVHDFLFPDDLETSEATKIEQSYQQLTRGILESGVEPSDYLSANDGSALEASTISQVASPLPLRSN
jgi:hypothetical protein